VEPRTRFELVTFAFLRGYTKATLLAAAGIYQAEPPGHVVEAAGLERVI
jgi:hypothetical protein